MFCIGHRADIISGKDLPKDIEWTYFENWKHIKHIQLGKILVGALICLLLLKS